MGEGGSSILENSPVADDDAHADAGADADHRSPPKSEEILVIEEKHSAEKPGASVEQALESEPSPDKQGVISRLTEELAGKDSRLDQYADLVTQKDKLIRGYVEDLKSMQEKHAESVKILRTTLGDKDAFLKDSAERSEKLESTLEETKHEMEKANRSISEREKDVEAAMEQLLDEQGRTEIAAEERDEWRRRAQLAESMEGEHRKLEKELQVVKNALADMESIAQQREQKWKDANKFGKDLSDENQALADDIARVGEELNQTKAKMSNAETALTAANAVVADLKATNSSLQESSSSLAEEVSSLTGRLEAEESLVKALRKEGGKLRFHLCEARREEQKVSENKRSGRSPLHIQ